MDVFENFCLPSRLQSLTLYERFDYPGEKLIARLLAAK